MENVKKHSKILFRFFSNVLDEWTVETLWAVIIDKDKNLYQIDNIPFYASVACGDIVLAEYDETESSITFKEIIEHSGNSTIQVVIMNNDVSISEVRNMFNLLSCESEQLNERYFVINVPSATSYEPVKKRLSELKNDGIIDYAEPVLSVNHWY